MKKYTALNVYVDDKEGWDQLKRELAVKVRQHVGDALLCRLLVKAVSVDMLVKAFGAETKAKK